MREFKQIPIPQLVDPEAPMRLQMDDEKFVELVEDIKRQGILQNLVVRPQGDVYQIIAGHRRLLAARQAGLECAPCMVVTDEDDNHLGMMIAENLFREDVTPVEEGELFKQVCAIPGITEDEIKRRIGKPLGYIYARMKLVDGDPDVALAVHQRRIVLGVAEELNKVKDKSYRAVYLERAVQSGSTIETVKQWVSIWRLNSAGLTEDQQRPLEPLPSERHVAQPMACRICGGTEDNYNLEPIWIHRAELQAILTAQQMVANKQADKAGA